MADKYIRKFEEVGIADVGLVGGKNASLGEMIKNLAPKGIIIPRGFVVTAEAYHYFLKESGLADFIRKTLADLDTKNLKNLSKRGAVIRAAIKKKNLPKDLVDEIGVAFQEMTKEYGEGVDLAVRSSATAEDLPGASFAGEHETFLNVRGINEVLDAVRASMASLFTDRAISYRVDKGFDHFKVGLSVGVQKMVRSDLGASGVIFTLDTESGFPDVVLINGVWGLGEMIVQGEVTPDEFLVFKKTKAIISKRIGPKTQKMIYGKGKKRTEVVAVPDSEAGSFVLSDEEVLKLAEWSMMIEDHYSAKNGKWTPMDIEWAKDGKTGQLTIVQARPETVHASRDFSKIREYIRKEEGKILVKGASVGSKIATGKARVILDVKDVGSFEAGEVLVTDMTDPDWEPIMKIAAAIVTDKGGRTSHAAIVSRELGIPCIVGSGNATQVLKTGQMLTVDTTGSDGLVFDGALGFEIEEHDVKSLPRTNTKIMMNIATPETAFEKSFLPNDGVGLAREEFIIASDIGIHPMALINYETIKSQSEKDPAAKNIITEIDKKTSGYADKKQFYVDRLAYGIAKIGAAFYPKPVIVRFSDFKTNEYRSLLGGEIYEPKEENPMIGWRGASRYYHPNFAPAFILELEAIKQVRLKMGLVNVAVMVPFCRTADEGKKVLDIIRQNGADEAGLKKYVMCEIPSNVIMADDFLDVFDGMSIGSNDLTQLVVGIDRDGNELIRGIANEKDGSVKKLISEIIRKCRDRGKYIGICGQAPSDYPDFAEFIVDEGIESMSLNPDTIIPTTVKVRDKELSKGL